MAFKLKIISSTVRPSRKGPLVAHWILKLAKEQTNFEVELLDLGEIDLPLMNEEAHPKLKKYEHEHTKRWSAKIEEADAFIFVTAEYNYGYPSPLRNSLEYLIQEWAYKPAGMVSYGGVSAGTRAANSLKADLSTLKIVPVMEMVNIPFFTQFISDEDVFEAPPQSIKAAELMFAELLRWSKGLKLIRENSL